MRPNLPFIIYQKNCLDWKKKDYEVGNETVTHFPEKSFTIVKKNTLIDSRPILESRIFLIKEFPVANQVLNTNYD